MAFTSKVEFDTDIQNTSSQATKNHGTIHANQATVLNELQDKVGIDSSTDPLSIDYKLTSSSSSNPGHKHTLAQGASDITATAGELNYSSGVTSAIQTQLNTKQAIVSGVSDTEIGYLDGVTSAIQTQLNAKAPVASPAFTGTVTLPTGLTGVIRADSGVTSVDSDVTDIVAAASSSAAGKVELAITSEIDTGTDSTRAIPVDQFVASARNVRHVIWRVLAATVNQSLSTTVGGDFEFPFTGTIVSIGAFDDTAGTTGTATYDVHLNGTTIMDTNKISIETGEKSSRDATTQPALTTTAITAGNILTADIDAIQTTPAKGLTIRLGVRLT